MHIIVQFIPEPDPTLIQGSDIDVSFSFVYWLHVFSLSDALPRCASY